MNRTVLAVFAVLVAAASHAAPRVDLGRLPLSFERNMGQGPANATFVSHSRDGALLVDGRGVSVITSDGAAAVTMEWVNGAPSQVVGEDVLPGRVNYLVGRDPAAWRSNIETFARVRLANAWPGVDVVLHGDQRHLEYDFDVAPFVDEREISLRIRGARAAKVNERGELVIRTGSGELIEHAPTIFEVDPATGERAPLSGRYVVRGSRVSFQVEGRHRDRALVIDPTLGYSTFLGGSSTDATTSVALDGNGNAYVVGYTNSANFPTTPGTIRPIRASANQILFISKLAPGGQLLLYSTYLGGTGSDQPLAVAVNAAGEAFVAGMTTSIDFPVTPSAVQSAHGGGTFDGFAVKLTPSGGSLAWATYLGGTGSDGINSIAINAAGDAWVVGSTSSSNFPVVSPFQTSLAGSSDAFVTRIVAGGASLGFSSYLGGSGDENANDVFVDGSDNAYVVGDSTSANFPTTAGVLKTTCNTGGRDGFIVRVASAGTVSWATCLGGNDVDTLTSVAVDSAGLATVAGYTASTNFPTTVGAFQTSAGGSTDAVVSRFDATGTALLFSTLLGGSGAEFANGVALGASNEVYAVGTTSSPNYPVTPGAYQPSTGGAGSQEAFLTRLVADGGTNDYSTYFGGSNSQSGAALAVDSAGNAVIGGVTASTNFPTTTGAFQRVNAGGFDGYAAKFLFAPAPSLTSVTPNQGPATGGTTVTLVGTGFQQGAAVTFGGTAASSVVVSGSTQATVTTPAGAAGTVDVVLTNPDGQSATSSAAFTFVQAVVDAGTPDGGSGAGGGGGATGTGGGAGGGEVAGAGGGGGTTDTASKGCACNGAPGGILALTMLGALLLRRRRA